jgi:tetratricopeptide (TPR) repeat protein
MTEPSMAARDSQALIDELWDFDDPAASEARFRTAAADDANAAFQGPLRTQIARALGLQRRFDNGVAILDSLGVDTREMAVRVVLERGRIENSRGNPAAARPYFESAAARAREAGLDNLAVDALHMVAIAAPPEEQPALHDQAIALASASTDPRARRWLASLYNNAGWTRFESGDVSGALEIFQLALAERESQGKPRETGIARWAVARALRALGRVDEAYAIQRDLLEINEAAGVDDPYVHEELGECLLALGQPDEARAQLAIALPALEADGYTAQAEPDRIARLRKLVKET